jgi:uncharacterized protein (TIGR02284 family)
MEMPTSQRVEALLRAIIRVAEAGREFFIGAQNRIADPDIRAAFAYAGDTKNRLISDLRPWLAHDAGGVADSIAATLVRMYADARGALRRRAPAHLAHALGIGENHLIRLVERAFEDTEEPALRRLLKTHYAQLLVCRQAMWRLNGRLAA